jgi:hypothetical protein
MTPPLAGQKVLLECSPVASHGRSQDRYQLIFAASLPPYYIYANSFFMKIILDYHHHYADFLTMAVKFLWIHQHEKKPDLPKKKLS